MANTSNNNASAPHREVIITSDDARDANQAVNDHFKKSMESITSGSAKWESKNVPGTFFSKPSSINNSVAHSRDNSTDSSGRFTMSPQSIVVQHSRTQSSPATLNARLSLTPSAQFGAGEPSSVQQMRLHQKHRSVDNTIDEKQPLPYGWEQKFTATGQAYFIDHAHKTTTWDDPRTACATTQPPSLPQGWEETYTPQGDKYYINHNDRTTSWYDPRLPEEVQKPLIYQRHAMREQIQQQRQLGTGRGGGLASAVTTRLPPQHPLLAAAENSGEGHHFQQQQQGPSGVNRTSLSGVPYDQTSQQRVQALNQERLRIRARQMEIRDQGLLNDRLSPGHPLSPGHCVGTDAFLGVSSLHPSASASVNPYSQMDFHTRQESGDSGLGMPYAYSHPHTPETLIGGNAEIDLNSFSGINLMDSVLMDVDPNVITGQLDISPNDLDQYLMR